MLSIPPVRGHDTGDKAHRNQIRQVHRDRICFDERLQYGIVTGKCLQDLSSVSLAHPGCSIMILHPAVLAAELLVRASVFDLIAAFKTMWHPSDIFPVSHFLKTVMIDSANL